MVDGNRTIVGKCSDKMPPQVRPSRIAMDHQKRWSRGTFCGFVDVVEPKRSKVEPMGSKWIFVSPNFARLGDGLHFFGGQRPTPRRKITRIIGKTFYIHHRGTGTILGHSNDFRNLSIQKQRVRFLWKSVPDTAMAFDINGVLCRIRSGKATLEDLA